MAFVALVSECVYVSVCVCVCVDKAELMWMQVRAQGQYCNHFPELHIAASINRPKDVSGCSAAPEEFSFTAFLALSLFSRFSSCACVCVCVCVCAFVLGCLGVLALSLLSKTFGPVEGS